MIKRIIKSFIKKIKPVNRNYLEGFEYTINELVGMYENSQEALKWHGELLSDNILKFKKSDTVFLLGSGPSINDIDENVWKHIAEHDSIGFNYWFVHDFVPSMYLFQLSKTSNILDILHDKYNNYSSVPFILRGSLFARGKFSYDDERLCNLKNNEVFFLREYPIHSTSSVDPLLLLKYLEALDLLSYGRISKFVPKIRGTLNLLIALSYQMGYKRIVLCGMDMNSNDHFWDYPPYLNFKQKYDLPDIGASKIDTFTDVSRSPNTVPVYIRTLKDWMKTKNNVDILSINQKTILYPDIQVYKF